jgi:hypothetical protein
MGRWTNSFVSTGIGWLTVAIMASAGVGAIYSLF